MPVQSCAVIVTVEITSNATAAQIMPRKRPPSLADAPMSTPLELIPVTTVEIMAVATPAVVARQIKANFDKLVLAFMALSGASYEEKLTTDVMKRRTVVVRLGWKSATSATTVARTRNKAAPTKNTSNAVLAELAYEKAL